MRKPYSKGTPEYEEYLENCYENGDEPCIDTEHHVWVESDDDTELCYCEKCSIKEY